MIFSNSFSGERRWRATALDDNLKRGKVKAASAFFPKNINLLEAKVDCTQDFIR